MNIFWIVNKSDYTIKEIEKAEAFYRKQFGDFDTNIEFVDSKSCFIGNNTLCIHQSRHSIIKQENPVLVSNFSKDAMQDKHLQNLYNYFLNNDFVLLNRSFNGSPFLESNKMIQSSFLANLNIPTIPSVLVSPDVSSEVILSDYVDKNFNFPVIVKPNQLARGFGVAKVQNMDELLSIFQVYCSTHIDFIIQPFVKTFADIRVYLSQGQVIASQTRLTGPNRHRANVSCGANSIQQPIETNVENMSETIAKALEADFLVVDWFKTGSGYVVNEIDSTLAGYSGLSPADSSIVTAAIVQTAKKMLHKAIFNSEST